jgi:hypothetical protein
MTGSLDMGLKALGRTSAGLQGGKRGSRQGTVVQEIADRVLDHGHGGAEVVEICSQLWGTEI